MSFVTLLVYLAAGLGAGAVCGLAGISTAVVITPLLVSVCNVPSYDAVTVALAADVLSSLLSAHTYKKNGNIDVRDGLFVMVTAFLGTVVGSWCGYLFSQAAPDGLGYISMATTVGLGFKFLLQPITKGADSADGVELSLAKRALAMVCGCGIGWVCGFTGSGGGVLMLMVFTLLLGFNLKIAVGTSTMIMTVVAATGTVSHFAMGAAVDVLPALVCVAACTLAAWLAAKFANKCEIRRLNHVVGCVLLALGVVTLAIKLL